VTPRPRLLIVGRNRYRLPLDEGLARKFDALGAELELRVLASAAAGSAGDAVFALVPEARPRVVDGALFHLLLPLRAACELRRFRPDAVLVQGAHEAFAVLLARRLARRATPVVLDLHGDWRGAARLYGSRARRLAAPLADRAAVAAIRRVDAVRTVSAFTSGLVRALGVEPAGEFPAFVDLEGLAGEPAPLPERPRALYVGALEPVKGIDVLAEAWPRVAARVAGAELWVVGRGSRDALVAALAADPALRVFWRGEVPGAEVARELDRSTLLVLPSRSEGLPRVAIEAFARGRGVVGSRAGGIADIVEDGVSGVLTEPGDAAALADALADVLASPERAARLGRAAAAGAGDWIGSPEEFAARLRALVEDVCGERRRLDLDPCAPTGSSRS